MTRNKYNIGDPIVHPRYGLRTVAAVCLKDAVASPGKCEYYYIVNYNGVVDNSFSNDWLPESFFEGAKESFYEYLKKKDPRSAEALRKIFECPKNKS